MTWIIILLWLWRSHDYSDRHSNITMQTVVVMATPPHDYLVIVMATLPCRGHMTLGLYIQLFDEGGLGIWKENSINSSHGTARMVEIDTEIDILSFLTLADVLGGYKLCHLTGG